MTVQELRDLLIQYPDDAHVVLHIERYVETTNIKCCAGVYSEDRPGTGCGSFYLDGEIDFEHCDPKTVARWSRAVRISEGPS